MRGGTLAGVVFGGMVGFCGLFTLVSIAFNAGQRSGTAPASVVAEPATQPTHPPIAPLPPPPETTMADVIDADAARFSQLQRDALVVALDDWEAQIEEDVTYAMLERNAQAFFAERAVFQGRILEIHDDPGGTMLRLGTGSYGADPIWIEADPNCVVDPHFVADTRVRVYGYLAGAHTYESQAGWNITIPAMIAVAVVPQNTPRHASASVRARAATPPQ